MATTISPANAQKVWVFAQNPDGTLSPATIGGGGGGGTVTSIATTSPITGGTITTTGTIGCATCTTNAAALTANALVIGGGAQATSALGSLGTTTTVLHGNAAGAPTFGAVNLAADVSGQLPISAVGSSGLSGTSPITISAAGAIGCATCETSAGISANAVMKSSGGQVSIASTITDGGAGVQVGSPTGGAQGAGTINVTGLFVNGAGIAAGCQTGCSYTLTTSDQVFAAGGTGSALTTNNQGAFVRFYNNAQRKIASACFDIATASAGGNIDVGVYSVSGTTGTLIWHTGAKSTTATGAICGTATTATLLAGQNYYVGWVADNTTVVLKCVANAGDLPTLLGGAGATANTYGIDATDTGTAGVLPNTITTTNIVNNNAKILLPWVQVFN